MASTTPRAHCNVPPGRTPGLAHVLCHPQPATDASIPWHASCIVQCVRRDLRRCRIGMGELREVRETPEGPL
jgi:hypothetical protein